MNPDAFELVNALAAANARADAAERALSEECRLALSESERARSAESEAAALRAVAEAHVKDNVSLGEENAALRADLRVTLDDLNRKIGLLTEARALAEERRTALANELGGRATLELKLTEARALLERWLDCDGPAPSDATETWLAANPEPPRAHCPEHGAVAVVVNEAFYRCGCRRYPEPPRVWRCQKCTGDHAASEPCESPRAAAERAEPYGTADESPAFNGAKPLARRAVTK